MKNIYVILIRSETGVGFFIRFMTAFKLNHVILSLENSLEPMFSYARYHREYAFDGGFIEESWRRYALNKDKVIYKVFSIPVSADKYQKVKQKFQMMLNNQALYKYSYAKAVENYFGLSPKSNNNNHSCLSFAVSILKEIGVIDTDTKVTSIEQLNDFLVLAGYESQDRVVEPEKLLPRKWGKDVYLENSNKLVPRIRRLIHHLRKGGKYAGKK